MDAFYWRDAMHIKNKRFSEEAIKVVGCTFFIVAMTPVLFYTAMFMMEDLPGLIQLFFERLGEYIRQNATGNSY